MSRQYRPNKAQITLCSAHNYRGLVRNNVPVLSGAFSVARLFYPELMSTEHANLDDTFTAKTLLVG